MVATNKVLNMIIEQGYRWNRRATTFITRLRAQVCPCKCCMMYMYSSGVTACK
jgi:hypothetical protein